MNSRGAPEERGNQPADNDNWRQQENRESIMKNRKGVALGKVVELRCGGKVRMQATEVLPTVQLKDPSAVRRTLAVCHCHGIFLLRGSIRELSFRCRFHR
jgi:hypothetical protein